MNAAFNADDMAEVRKQGDLKALFAALMGKPAAAPAPPVEDEQPTHHLTHPGAWPCGTAPTGPSPGPRCTQCAPARPHHVTAIHRPAEQETAA